MGLLLAAATLTTDATARPRFEQPTRTGFVTASAPRSGPVQLYVESSGHGAPLVLLHGLGASGYMWRHMVPTLATTHRVVTIDLRGFGRSHKPFDDAYDPATQAILVIDTIERMKLSGVTLVGHSFGGLVAAMATLHANHHRPRLVRRLVVMDAPLFPQPLSPAVRFLQTPVLPYVVLNVVPPELPAALALFTEQVGMEMITRSDVAMYAEPYRDAAARHALIETARQIEPPNAAALIRRYRSLRQPTLVIWCRNDNVVPLRTGQLAARAIPRARLVVLDGCDHIPPEQQPEATLAALATFLAR